MIGSLQVYYQGCRVKSQFLYGEIVKKVINIACHLIFFAVLLEKKRMYAYNTINGEINRLSMAGVSEESSPPKGKSPGIAENGEGNRRRQSGLLPG